MSRCESPVAVAAVKKNGPCTLSRDTAQKTLTSGESRLWLLVSPIRTLYLFTLPLMWNVASSEISLYTKPFSFIFNCISSQNSRLYTLPAGVRICTNRILYGLKHSRLRNTFHTVIYGMPNSLLAVVTDLRGLRWNASRTFINVRCLKSNYSEKCEPIRDKMK
jgi:hypothetical protein